MAKLNCIRNIYKHLIKYLSSKNKKFVEDKQVNG
jgi:hypothetical protein